MSFDNTQEMLWESHSVGLGLGVGNETWTGLGNEFKVPIGQLLGQKLLQNDFYRAFPEIGWVLSNDTP